MGTWAKTCGLPRLVNFEPHPPRDLATQAAGRLRDGPGQCEALLLRVVSLELPGWFAVVQPKDSTRQRFNPRTPHDKSSTQGLHTPKVQPKDSTRQTLASRPKKTPRTSHLIRPHLSLDNAAHHALPSRKSETLAWQCLGTCLRSGST